MANKIRFTPIESIDRNTKKANIEALNYYVNEKTNEIQKTLLSKKYNEWVLRDYPEMDPLKQNFVSTLPSDLPLVVVTKYQRELTNYKNTCLLDFAEKSFSSYINSTQKTNTYVEWSNGDISGLKKIENRFSSSYRDKIIKRMNWLMWKYGNENCCLLTLTIDPKKYNNNKFEMWKAIGKKYKRFIDKMRVYFKRHNRPFPSYLFGIESMFGRAENNYIARGNPHLHVCFFNCKYFAPVETIEKYWGQGFVKINSTAKNEKVRYPIHYITKYITKTFTVNDPKNVLCQSLVWLFNKHSFDRSAGLVLPLHPKGSGDCYTNGLWSIPAGYQQFDEMIMIQDTIHSLLGGFKTPPPIPINHVSHGGVIT
jgi:hypothetical protein